MTYYNVYAFTPDGDAVRIEQDLTEADAVWTCQQELAHFPASLEQFGAAWYEPGMVPRLAFYPAAFDPFPRKTHIVQVADWQI